MASNSERPLRFDLRTTIPLATETLVHIAKQPKRSWIIPALTIITALAFASVMFDLIFSPSPVAAFGYQGELRSRLSADYTEDPVAARIHELRLAIVEDVLGMDTGDSGGSSEIASLLKDPVPTTTPKATQPPTNTAQPSATSDVVVEPTVVATATVPPDPSGTPAPPTEMASGNPCGELSISNMWIHSDDEVRARVRNSGSEHVYLVHTVFEWPDVPDPAQVDWFEFDGDRYYRTDDWDSPTIAAGSHERLRRGDTDTWQVDFDDEPDEGIYGSFNLMLTFRVPGLGDCTLSRSIFREIPITQTPTLIPSAAPTSASTSSPVPTDVATQTPTPDPTSVPTEATTPPAATEPTDVPPTEATPATPTGD